jgi:hypothetical protein
MPTDPELLAGRYELRRQLGSGAMGTVWHAHDRQTSRAVAIKRIHPQLLLARPGLWEPAEAVSRFRREAALLEQLDHPGIPSLYEAQLNGEGNEHYIAMELVLGQTLEQVTRDRQLSEPEIISIAVQMCEILEYAHAIPIIHRDIKPANVMLTNHQQVVILDYGVAAIFTAAQQPLTLIGRTLGTIGYMPPEQLMGREVNPRSDLFALACLLYHLRTGIPPFNGPQYGRPLPLSLLQSGVDPCLEAVIMAALAKRPADRPASAREFRDRLLGSPAIHPPVQQHAESAQPREVRITQAQALFDAGQLGAAFRIFAQLVAESAPSSDAPEMSTICRLRLAQCRSRLGHQDQALKEFQELDNELAAERPAEDRLLLRVHLEIGKLRIALDEEGGLADLARVYQILSDTRRPEDELLFCEARDALNRATLGV